MLNLPEDLSAEDREKVEARLEKLTIAGNLDEVRAEIDELQALIEQAERVKAEGIESKLARLRDEILSSLGDRKLLLFTEHKDTLWYLEEKLCEWGYAVNIIHGGMSLDARIEAEHVFKHETQIMVATEAAGEGINLQFCSLMVNYDIPWNPNRLEQRMGRIHRYGQNYEVFIYNLIARDTREGQILGKLFDKLNRMRASLGTDLVFDIIGEVIPGTNLKNLLTEAIFNQRRMEEIEHIIEEVNETSTQETLDRVLMSSLASRHIDYTGLLKETRRAEENRLVPEYVQDFFLRGFQQMGGTRAATDKGFRIENVPLRLRRMNEDLDFKTRFGEVRRNYRRITFEKEVARRDNSYEFVAPGHPLLEALNETILRNFQQDGAQYAAFVDPVGEREGALWFVEGIVCDGTGAIAGRRVFCVLQNTEGDMQVLNPGVLWDLEAAPDADAPASVMHLMEDRTAIENHLMAEVLFPYRAEIQERRAHDAQVKREYGLQSLSLLIAESNQKLLDYAQRAAEGEDMNAATRQEERNLERLQRREEMLEQEIRLECNVTVNEPKVLGVAAVMPAPRPAEVTYAKSDGGGELLHDSGANGMAGGAMDVERKKEIEQVGMRIATAYEEEQGRSVEDVSGAGHGGFDLRSVRFGEDGALDDIRYIEVKARSRSGKIRLTSNEWKRARHLGEDYWIYVVANAGTDAPELVARIQNPAERFSEGENIFASGYEIPEDEWRAFSQLEKDYE